MFLIFYRGKAYVGVRQHIGKLFGHGIGVDRDWNSTEHLRCHDGPVESRPVGADDRDRFAALEAQPMQADRIGTNDVEHIGPGPRLPDAQILVAHGRPCPKNLGIADQQLGKRIRPSGSGQRHSSVLPYDRALKRDTNPSPSCSDDLVVSI